MSQTLWHTIHIQIPDKLLTVSKSGKVSLKQTLSKKGAISNSNKEPSIIISSSSNITKPHIISEGNEVNEIDLRNQKERERAIISFDKKQIKNSQKKQVELNAKMAKLDKISQARKMAPEIAERTRKLEVIRKRLEKLPNKKKGPTITDIQREIRKKLSVSRAIDKKEKEYNAKQKHAQYMEKLKQESKDVAAMIAKERTPLLFSLEDLYEKMPYKILEAYQRNNNQFTQTTLQKLQEILKANNSQYDSSEYINKFVMPLINQKDPRFKN